MSLADRLGGDPERPGRRTRVGEILVALPSKDADALLEALGNPKWSSLEIARALREEKHIVSEKAVRYYREMVL